MELYLDDLMNRILGKPDATETEITLVGMILSSVVHLNILGGYTGLNDLERRAKEFVRRELGDCSEEPPSAESTQYFLNRVRSDVLETWEYDTESEGG